MNNWREYFENILNPEQINSEARQSKKGRTDKATDNNEEFITEEVGKQYHILLIKQMTEKKTLRRIYTGWPKMNEGVLIRYNFLFKT